jgi:hypothetical protein
VTYLWLKNVGIMSILPTYLYHAYGIDEALQAGKARHPLHGGHGAESAEPVKNLAARLLIMKK